MKAFTVVFLSCLAVASCAQVQKISEICNDFKDIIIQIQMK